MQITFKKGVSLNRLGANILDFTYSADSKLLILKVNGHTKIQFFSMVSPYQYKIFFGL